MPPAYDLHCRQGAVHLRLLAYLPEREPVPEGCLRAVVQVVADDGRPIAEDPIHTEVLPETELRQGLALSQRDGWVLEPWRS